MTWRTVGAVAIGVYGCVIAVAQWISADDRFRFRWDYYPLLKNGSKSTKKAYSCFIAVIAITFSIATVVLN